MSKPASEQSTPRSFGATCYAAGCAGVALIVAGWLTELFAPGTEGGLNALVLSGIYLIALALAVPLATARSGVPTAEVGVHPICAHCMQPYREGAHVCPRDGMPQTFFAATGPYERAHAQAWAIGKAVRHPTRRCHVIGIVIFTGPTVFGLPITFLAVMGSGAQLGTYAVAHWLGFGALMWLLHAYVLHTCLKNWRLYREAPEALPPESEYGSPPWWTYDVGWTVVEDDEAPDGRDADDLPYDEPGEPPPLPRSSD